MNEDLNHGLTLVTGKTDTELAREFRSRMIAKLGEICEIVNEAEREGLEINFSLGRPGVRVMPDGAVRQGFTQVVAVSISKPL